MKTRFQAFALAAVLALTAITGSAAALGLSHWGSHTAAAAPAVAQAPVAASWNEQEGGD
jgi:hypothetical protein